MTTMTKTVLQSLLLFLEIVEFLVSPYGIAALVGSAFSVWWGLAL